MGENLALPEIRVEGTDDLHSIQELLHLHGILCSTEKLDIIGSKLRIIASGNVDQMERTLPNAIRAATSSAYGFVLDADQEPKRRWEGLRHRLHVAGIEAPDSISQNGLIETSANGRVRVGVWMMPDNLSVGMLEDFLQRLISTEDLLISHAIEATDKAKDILGAKFIEEHRPKARIHTWLAWQEAPGRPFGIGIKSGYFQKDAALAMAFVKWIRELCQIP